MALSRVHFGLRFGLGLASLAANTRQGSGKKAGGDIDFAAFYILPVPSSLSAKWRRVKIGSLRGYSLAVRVACLRNTPSASATFGSPASESRAEARSFYD